MSKPVEDTQVLMSESPPVSVHTLNVEGEIKHLSVRLYSICLYKKKWLVLLPLPPTAIAIQAFQSTIPGYKYSGLGVCQPHELLAIEGNKKLHISSAQIQLEETLKCWNLSVKENWDKMGHHAVLALLALCKGKVFNVHGKDCYLKCWRVCGKDVEMTFEDKAGIVKTIRMDATEAWDLRSKGIYLTIRIVRIPLPALWYNGET